MRGSIKRRLKLLTRANEDRVFREIVRRHVANDIVAFFNDWLWTYDPRQAEQEGGSAYLPFDLWPRQEEYLRWLDAGVAAREELAVPKSRDVGLTYLNAGFALHCWLFRPGFATGFGSRKEEYVDQLGNPRSIFEKMRVMLYRLPVWMQPPGFVRARHDLFRRLVNPDNGNSITGEAGDQIGRGDRATVYFIDEAAFLERAERVEGSLLATTECRIWVSSANGQGNVFARKVMRLPPERVFRFHYTDDPRKTPEWAARKKAETEPHIWASEYEIDFAASLEGVCIPAPWVRAARDLSRIVEARSNAPGVGGLDVGGGKARSVFVAKTGPVVGRPTSWGDPDTTDTAHRGLREARAAGVAVLHFDTIGIGEGVASTLRRNVKSGLRCVPVNTGDSPTATRWPDGRSSREMFASLKAELWWLMRNAFKRSHERLLWETGQEGGVEHPVEDCVLLPAASDSETDALAAQLSLPRWFTSERGKIRLERKDELARRGVPSPDHADALALAFRPVSQGDPIIKLVGH